jgi:hypothetical protein
MAVAARTFGWNRATLISGSTYRIDSSGQTFFPEKTVDDEQKYQNAATLTNGQFLSHSDGNGTSKVINAQHRRQNGDPTNPCSIGQGSNCPTPPDPCSGLFLSYFMDAYLKGVTDPISNGETRSQIDCNSAGLSQYGTQRWAIGKVDPGAAQNLPNFPQWNYQQILAHYYTDVHLNDANTDMQVTPEYRWNPINAKWQGTGTINSPAITPGNIYNVTVWYQNSGADDWNHRDEPDYIHLSYYWDYNNSLTHGTTPIAVHRLDEGEGEGDDFVVLPIFVPGSFQNGYTVTLAIDMLDVADPPTSYFSNREAGWYPLIYECVIGEVCIIPGSDIPFGGVYLPIIVKNAS